MHSTVRPGTWVALRLPSETTKILQILPNTTVSLGKYGTFPANQIIGRPYYMTYELLDPVEAQDGHILRLVSAAELHAESLLSDGTDPVEGENEEDLERVINGDGDAVMRTNRDTVDDVSSQKLTWEEIEALKKQTTGTGREIIAKLLESHSALDQKTAFSLAKYTLRKRKKYLKRFTVLPVDVSLLTNFMLHEKDPAKTMELRDETLGLIGCWANVHHAGNTTLDDTVLSRPSGRWLMVDETGGLLVAAMAERMGILYPSEDDDAGGVETTQPKESLSGRVRVPGMSAKDTTLTLLHPNAQPNISLLKYFGFDSTDPPETHPLHTHLKTVSWMQVLDPESDSIYANEPADIPEETLATMKASKRGMYYRKKRRFARVRSVVDETRSGGFDGLVVASVMDPASILRHAVPLLAGSAQVVVFSPHIEPLVKLADLYSTARRTAYINLKRDLQLKKAQQEQPRADQDQDASDDITLNSDDFPVDPTLLLAPTIQTSRVRPWQVLPGRTHPHMVGRGGAEGYVFHALRVIPSQGKVEARGKPGRKKRKIATETSTPDIAV